MALLSRKVPLLRRIELRAKKRPKTWRRPDADKVTPALHNYILARDRQCIGHTLGAAYPCRDKWGDWMPADDLTRLELDHIRDAPMMGKRAPSDARHLVAMCPGHHRLDGWATANRPRLRAYLAEVESGDGQLPESIW